MTGKKRVIKGAAALVTVAAAAGLGFAALPALAGPAKPASSLSVLERDLKVHRNMIMLSRMHHWDGPSTTAQCQAQFQLDCYNAAQVQRAYHLNGLFGRHLDGRGKTIVLIDEFGSPTIDGDLATFDNQEGVPGASLKEIEPVGAVASFDSGNADQVGWAGETSLDVEWAHAMAPGARLVLLAVPDQQGLVEGLKYAIDHRLGDVISLSWGAAEPTADSSALRDADNVLFKTAARKRITILNASGDVGATGVREDGSLYTYPVVNWPASDPNVTGVGGTQLHLDGSGNKTSADTVWNDSYNQAADNLINNDNGPDALATGGGKSSVFGWPHYQAKVTNVTGWRRGVPDVSMSGACSGAVNIYTSFSGSPSGWTPVCGTSESAPLFAGIVAIADQAAGHPLGMINPALYQLSASRAPGIAIVSSGNNTVAFTQDGSTVTVHGYYARNGYSMAAGVGTINAQYFVFELSHPSAHGKPKHHR